MTSYYVEKDGFTAIAGFVRISSSGTLVSLDTTDFHIEGKEGKWLAFDSIIIDGRQFFLMEHETYGKEVAWVVLDEEGKIIVDHTYQGFDQTALQQSCKNRKYPMGISRRNPAMLWISRLLKTGRNIWRMGSISAVPR